MKTKRLIQRRALELFAAKGYDATTMEEIAAAAEISPSTVFRYYPTKAALIITDIYDDMVADVYRSQPAHLDALEALEETIVQLAIGQSDTDPAEALTRTRIAAEQPAIWMSALPVFLSIRREVKSLLAERSGRDPDDPVLGFVIGATLGMLMEVLFATGYLEDPVFTDLQVNRVREGFKGLREGFPL